MTCKAMIEILFNTGLFSTVYKLLMVINCWISGLISLTDAQELCTACGFTFTKPAATGQTVLTDGTTAYTLVSLITDYHDNAYSKSISMEIEIHSLIDALQKSGYLTTDEQTSLKGLGW